MAANEHIVEKPSFLSLMTSSVVEGIKGGIVGAIFGGGAGLAIGAVASLVTLNPAWLFVGAILGSASMSLVGTASGSMTGVVNKSREGMVGMHEAASAVKLARAHGVALGVHHEKQRQQNEETTHWRKQAEESLAARNKQEGRSGPPG